MTPLSKIEGTPVTGNLHGVVLDPAGLQLHDAATLEITPASGDTTSAIGFAAHDDNVGASFSDFHLVAPARTGNAGSVTFNLFHFSLHGAYLGTEAQRVESAVRAGAHLCWREATTPATAATAACWKRRA